MIDCKNLVHPFQNDPGTSQSQRVIDELLSGSAKIDGRTLADLLNFFTKLAPHINFYDTGLQVSDWQPFFQKSFPFLLASISNYDTTSINEKFNFYTSIFQKKPTSPGLQLSISYVFYNIIKKINDWYEQFKVIKLPIVTTLQQSIKNKLQQPLKQFIAINNASHKWYCTKAIDLTDFIDNDLWGLDMQDLFSIDSSFMNAGKSKRKRLAALQSEIVSIFPSFTEAIKTIAAQAQQDLPKSFILNDEGFQQNNAPHLALLFCFLKIFQQQMDDLNSFTKKHLDFFYKDVLQLKPQDATADKANIVFQLQKQVTKYLLSKNILVKDGKDSNNADIEFALDDDIVVNETQIADVRTLFLNNKTAYEKTYVEGVYMAPNALKANGIDKDFSDSQPKNYPTLGNKYSKYTPATKTTVQEYPGARIGFILASYIFYLDKATRNIDITLSCQLNENCVTAAPIVKKNTHATNSVADEEIFPTFIPSEDLYHEVHRALEETYVYVNEDLIQAAIKKGIEKPVELSIRKHLRDHCKKTFCGDDTVYYKDETTVEFKAWTKSFTEIEDKLTIIKGASLMNLLNEIFPPRHAFKVSFSGDKDWILPALENLSIKIISSEKLSHFNIHINSILTSEQEAVTFYNKANLKEDFGTTQPLVKIELDEALKIKLENVLNQNKDLTNTSEDCCLDRKPEVCGQEISLYHFLRNMIIVDTKIDVDVCNLKNFIVQNFEVLEDVNSPIYPFGTVPVVNNDFYIGSEEIFLKNWKDVWINVNWKDKPDLTTYYEEYATFYPSPVIVLLDKVSLKKKGKAKAKGNDDTTCTEGDYLMKVSYLQDDVWYIQKAAIKCNNDNSNDIGPYNCLFPPVPIPFSPCFIPTKNFYQDFSHQYYYNHQDFINLELKRKNKVPFTGIKKHDTNTTNCFLKWTLKCNNFHHDIYPIVLANYLIAQANFKITGQNDPGSPPNQPWTPIISNMSIDYTATAGPDDIDLIHLYPYDGTYKDEQIKMHPPLVATFCDEGTLFLGLQNLEPGSNVNILFQLAEATSDSETDPQDVYWKYLVNNTWVDLRKGFEIIDDATDNLTRSGIIKFSFPNNISTDNTVMPNTLYWIKAAVPQNSRAVCETLAIYTQAMSATFTNTPENDKLRLSTPLVAGSISSLTVADANIKQVTQPGATFGGHAREDNGPEYYLRVSELLRHKGRAIQKFDYERLALQQFPQLFKVKCINHSFALNANNYINDFPIAPGYVLLAVIPDLNQLQAGNSFEPKVPVSMLEDIETNMQACTSPFVRFRAMNPRYETINFCMRVQLMPDRDTNYFQEKLKEDLREFLAPWAVGKYDKLTFGQCVNRSDIINFIETLEYVDYILKLEMFFAESDTQPMVSLDEICPATPRSILIAGDIEVSIQSIACEEWSLDGACGKRKIKINNYCKEEIKILSK